MRRSAADDGCSRAGPGARSAVLGAGILAALFVAGTFVAPLLEGTAAAGALEVLYAPLCHQLPERSLPIGAGHQAVCARCSGLYLGGVAGLLVGAWMFVGTARPLRPFWFFALAVPTAAEAVLGWAGLAALTNVPRLLLAWPAGLGAGLFLAVGVGDLFDSARRTNARVPIGSGAPRIVEEVDG